jgi:hypothetical protein
MARGKHTKIIKTSESIAEQKAAHPMFTPEITHDITMVVPGRRALGEDWVKVTIGHDADNIVYDTAPAEAPADRKPIMAVTGREQEYASYILTAQMEKAKSRAVTPQDLTPKERYDAVNAAWQDYLEQKVLALRGVSTFGAAGGFQRQRVAQNPNTRPLMHKEW